ncbi:MAG TPA: hypothetical protein VMZ53_26840, partial [Kofleriaceae bacterium]|nr:hypothetical protein [Kofleriaceae bacterium]
MRRLLLLGLMACSPTRDDVVGPFTGQPRRFYVDRIDVPRDNAQALAVAADLDGDDAVENQFGNVTGVLASTNDLSTNSADMIAAGSLASYVDIQADDLMNDAAVGITYVGDESELGQTPFGGKFVDGAFISNRTRDTEYPGKTTVHLPVYTNANPLVLLVEGAELELTPDGDGYTGILRGGLREETAREAAYFGLIDMFQNEPERHLVFGRGIDANHDGAVSREEVDASVIALLVTADVDLFDGSRLAPHAGSQDNDCISVAFQFHLSPTPPTGPAQNTCRDRMGDGDESGNDCGGSCQKCWDHSPCAIDADCQSGACIPGGPLEGTGKWCAEATCTDGVRDAFE